MWLADWLCVGWDKEGGEGGGVLSRGRERERERPGVVFISVVDVWDYVHAFYDGVSSLFTAGWLAGELTWRNRPHVSLYLRPLLRTVLVVSFRFAGRVSSSQH